MVDANTERHLAVERGGDVPGKRVVAVGGVHVAKGALDFALVVQGIAAGRLDGYWERGIAPWDVTAGAVLVTEAGGTISDFRGNAFVSDNRELVASNGLLHRHLLDVIAQHPDAPVELVRTDP